MTFVRSFVFLAILIALAACSSMDQPPDLILTNGRIVTGVEDRPSASAVAIRGTRIVAVGESSTLATLAGPSTRVIDLRGRVVIPGINDAHVHAPWPSGKSLVASLPQEGVTKEVLLNAIAAAALRAPEDATITAALPLQLIDAGLTRDDLDAISSTRRILVTVFGGHSAILNTPALRAWGIAEDATDPPGGWYGRSHGRLNGWLYEHAYWLPQKRYADSLDDDEIRKALLEFEQEALRYGITSVQTYPLVSAQRTERILASVPAVLRWRVIDLQLAPYSSRASARTPVKYILDGTPIERTAAMRTAYVDAPRDAGRMNYSPAEIEAMVQAAAAGGQLHVHAVGDKTIESVLDAMEKTPADWPALRVRIEHGDSITDDLATRARKLGVIVVQNPAHFTIRETMLARYGERAATMQPARSLIAAGNRFAIGSDGPLNPFLNMFFAAIHPTNPSEALTVEQSLRAYTHGAAFAEFQEREKGTIEVGKLADLAVLSQDIFAVAPPELPKTESVMTIIGGKVMWEAPSDAAGITAPASSHAEVVRPGIETFLADVPPALRGKRIGLITNQSGIDRAGVSDIDLIAQHKDLKLVALLAPEHGIRGTAEAGETISDAIDSKTGVPIYSLYIAEDRGPTEAMLKDVDALIYDLQEVGGRTWTYVSTMALAMQAAARKGIPFVVLDRPNPIGGEIVEGALLDPRFKSFVGMYPIPARHGMTVGELAMMFNEKYGIGADLIVARAAHWRRSQWMDDTGLPWVNPSPNLRSLAALSSYPGTVYFEGTTLTEGRGTDRPFEQIGAPWLDAETVARTMNARGLPGVRFEATTMAVASTAAKHGGQTIPAIRFVITDREAYRPVRTSLLLIDEIRRQHPRDFAWTATIDRLTGSDKVRLAIEGGWLPALLDEWDREAMEFRKSRALYLLYE